MSLDRVKTWQPGEVLTAGDLNAEFNNLLTNAMALITPLILQNLGAAPGVSDAGRIYYNSVTQQVELDDGTNIRVIPSVLSTNVDSGDVIVGTTEGSFEVLSQSDALGVFNFAQNNTGAATLLTPVL